MQIVDVSEKTQSFCENVIISNNNQPTEHH